MFEVQPLLRQTRPSNDTPQIQVRQLVHRSVFRRAMREQTQQKVAEHGSPNQRKKIGISMLCSQCELLA